MKKIVCFIICLFCFPLIISAEEISLVKCVDGDTADFLVDNKTYKVRFLAVDTPETKHPTKGAEPFGMEASEFTCNSLKGADKIELEYDSNSNKKDKYDRLLGWIFVDDELLQAKLIENGLAKVAYLYNDYKYTNELQILQKRAKNNNVGIWGDYKPNYDNYILVFVCFILFVILFVLNKKFRSKKINLVMRKIKNEMKKNLKK